MLQLLKHKLDPIKEKIDNNNYEFWSYSLTQNLDFYEEIKSTKIL